MKYLVFAIILCLQSCMNLPEGVEASLQEAGRNRRELQKVLRHYKKNPADSLKFRAACFLIDHMKWHKQGNPILQLDTLFRQIHSDIDLRFRSISEALSLKDLTGKEARYIFGKKEKLTKSFFNQDFRETELSPERLPDLQCITARFLMAHIDNAFQMRTASSHASRISFEDFCNYLLPYRACEFAYFNDGQELNRMFSPYVNNPTAKTLNERIGWYNAYVFRMKCLYGKCPIQSPTGIYDLFFNQKLDCTGTASHAANILRACGLPTAIDYNSAHREFVSIHFHCSVLDTIGKWLAFNPETGVLGDYDFSKYNVANIFRFMFAPQEDSPYMLKAKEESLPMLFASPCLKEVTSETKQVSSVTLPFPDSIPNRLAYLYVFQSNRVNLTPATWGIIDPKQNTVNFTNVLPDLLYFPVYLDKNKVKHFASPFMLTNCDTSASGYNLHYLEELTDYNETDKSNLILTRKFPRKSKMLKIAQEMVGGAFYGANQKDFSDARLLCTIAQTPEAHLQECKILRPRPYKYYRYSAPQEHPASNISLLEFLTNRKYGYSDTTPATPLPILFPKQTLSESPYVKLLDASSQNKKQPPYDDGNMTTSSGSKKEITITFNIPQIVEAIRFAPLNADNGVNPGEYYELMYWEKGKGWQSGGIKKAAFHYVEFENVPINRLYWLRNLDNGKEELPFIIKDGQQQFLYYELNIQQTPQPIASTTQIQQKNVTKKGTQKSTTMP